MMVMVMILMMMMMMMMMADVTDVMLSPVKKP